MALTVKIAWLEVTLLTKFVAITRYLLPFIAKVTFVRDKLALVAPAMFDHVLPALVDTCHWNVGAGLPVAATLKVAVCPALTVWLCGCVTIAGGIFCIVTVNETWFEVTEPAAFVTITRYLLPFIAAVTFVSDKLALVAPAMFDHVLPALVDTCH